MLRIIKTSSKFTWKETVSDLFYFSSASGTENCIERCKKVKIEKNRFGLICFAAAQFKKASALGGHLVFIISGF